MDVWLQALVVTTGLSLDSNYCQPSQRQGKEDRQGCTGAHPADQALRTRFSSAICAAASAMIGVCGSWQITV